MPKTFLPIVPNQVFLGFWVEEAFLALNLLPYEAFKNWSTAVLMILA
jgi:hypothetical protein